MGRRKSGFGEYVKLGAGMAVGFLIVMVALAFVLGELNLLPGATYQQPSEVPEPAPMPGVEALPLKLYVSDAINGGAISGTAYILDPDTYTVIETVDITTSGGTTVRFYDYSVLIVFESTGYACAPITFDPWTAPIVSVGGQNYYLVDIYAYKEPSEAEFSMLVFDELGNVLADESNGHTYNMTGTDVSITIQLTVPAGKALINYFDYLEGDSGEDDALVLIVKMNDTLASLDIGTRVEYGGYVYYIVTLSDIISTKTDPAVLRETFTLYYGGSGALSVTIEFMNNVDPNIVASSLTVDTDTTLHDTLATFVIA